MVDMEEEEIIKGAKVIHDVNNMLKKYGRYIVEFDKTEEYNEKAYEDIEVLGYLGLSKFPRSEHTGDDWDDSPAECNAGPPYKKEGDDYSHLEIRDKTKIYTVKDMADSAIEIIRYLRGIKTIDT